MERLFLRESGHKLSLMDDSELLEVLHAAADAIAGALALETDWGPSGQREGQYQSDLTADEAAWAVLSEAGLAVMSEESGHRGATDAEVVVALDPLDGSTNAAQGIPWYATSLCAVDADGARVAVVLDLAHGTRFEAVRGGGARRNGETISTTGQTELRRSIVGVSGLPTTHYGWAQFRALGAMALDLCAVASGTLDGVADLSVDAHGPWDYLGGLLVCTEAGGTVLDVDGRDLMVTGHLDRRTPVAGASAELAEELFAARVANGPAVPRPR